MKTLFEIYILLIYTIVNLTLIKVIYNWLHESHKTTNTSTNSRNNDLNGYVFNTNTLRVWVQPIFYARETILLVDHMVQGNVREKLHSA